MVVGLTGCATVITKSDPTEGCTNDKPLGEPVFVYSGAKCDLRSIHKLWTNSPIFFGPFFSVINIVDLPVSAVADTLVLPWSLHQQRNRELGHGINQVEDMPDIIRPKH